MAAKYKQCMLEKKMPGALQRKVTYLPTKFAKVGGVLKLKDEQGAWDDGWKVLSVGSTEQEDSSVRKKIRQHRKNTGDALPK